MTKTPPPTEEIKTKKDSPFEIVGTKAVKLKDRPNNRRYVMVDLKSYFGTIPEVVIIEKVYGRNNAIVIKGIIKKAVPVKIPKADVVSTKRPIPKVEKEKRKADNL